MKSLKDQIVDLFKLFLACAQGEYEEVANEISPNDRQFINIEFAIQFDEDAKKVQTQDLSLGSCFFKKKEGLERSVSSLRENSDFRSIAAAWNATTAEFDTSHALEQFCRGVAAEHQSIYGLLHPACLSFLEKFADGLLQAIQNGSYPIHCLVFLKDLWVNESSSIIKPFESLKENVSLLLVRRPEIHDYEKSCDLKKLLFIGRTQNLQIQMRMQSAVIEFFWYDKIPIKFPNQSLSASIKFQSFQYSLDTIFLLLGNASVRMTEFRYSFGHSGGINSIFDSSPGRCLSIKNLERKLSWVGQLMMPVLLDEMPWDETVKRALQYYRDSLFRSLGAESRISLSISGLEALYLSAQEVQPEITLRLTLRVTRVLGYLGFDSIDVERSIAKAYAIRSCHVHGAGAKKKKLENIDELSEKVDDYLRLSILVFQHCLNSKCNIQNILQELHNASFSRPISENILRSLQEAKEILI